MFAVPCPNASYKLLDRVVIVRGGYPVSQLFTINYFTKLFGFPADPSFDFFSGIQVAIRNKGTIIAIEPNRNHNPGTEITENDLHTMDILMDEPYKVSLASGEFKRHKIFRTRSTNMLVNISYGRAS